MYLGLWKLKNKINMKKKSILLLAATFMGSLMSGQQLVNLTTVPATDQDVVRSIPTSSTNLKRLGHLQSGTWANGLDTWSALGIPIVSTLGNTPNDPALYGLTVNNQGDRSFFGSRYFGYNRCDGIVAWGDDNWGNSTSNNPDRLVFEFHDSNAGGGTTIKQAMTMMPDPTNTGVFVGVGTYTPTEQIHSTQGVRFQGLVTGTIKDLVGIDANGKLWRTPVPTAGSSLGNLCSVAQNPLSGNYEIPLGNKKFFFSGTSTINSITQQDMVAIGYACNSGILPAAKFNVFERQFSGTGISNEMYAGYFINGNFGTASNTIGGAVYGLYNTLNTNSTAFNVGGIFEGFGTNNTVGVIGRTSKSTANGSLLFGNSVSKSIGVFGIADTLANSTTGSILMNIGVCGYGDKAANSNIGVLGEVGSNASGFCVGVYGKAPSSNTGALSKWAGYFDGDVNITGQALINTTWYFSDKRFKNNIKVLENVNDKLKKIHGYTYKFKTEEFKDRNFSDREQIGLIAQELKEVFPQLVSEWKDGYMAVNYQGLVPVLLEAIKEQQTQIEQQNTNMTDQQKQIDELKAIVKSLANNTVDVKDKALVINLSDKNAIVLNQNVPNPFAESTVISYNIPVTFTKAQIIFTTNEGKVIKTVDVIKSGEGTLNVFANDLTNGLYNYTLVIDGKNIETKKMIKQ